MYKLKALVLTKKEKRALPRLIENEDWSELFSEKENESIKRLSKELKKLIDEETAAEEEFRIITKDKKKAMSQILALSDQVNNEKRGGALIKLDKQKKLTEKLKAKAEDVRFRLETIPNEIAEVNFLLLEATVEEGFNELVALEEKNSEINREMIEIRDRLRELFEERNKNDETISKIYTHLHGTLGADLIEKIEEKDETGN